MVELQVTAINQMSILNNSQFWVLHETSKKFILHTVQSSFCGLGAASNQMSIQNNS